MAGPVAQRQDADGGREDCLADDEHGRRGRDAAALQRRGEEQHRPGPRDDGRVHGGLGEQVEQFEAGDNPPRDRHHTKAQPGDQAEQRCPQPLGCQPCGQADGDERQRCDDEAPAEAAADRGGAFALRGQPEQPEADADSADRRPLAAAQPDAEESGGYRGDGEAGGQRCLDDEEWKHLQCGQLEPESTQVKPDSSHEPPLPDHPDEQPGIDALTTAGRRRGSHRLHHRRQAIGQSGSQGAQQSPPHTPHTTGTEARPFFRP